VSSHFETSQNKSKISITEIDCFAYIIESLLEIFSQHFVIRGNIFFNIQTVSKGSPFLKGQMANGIYDISILCNIKQNTVVNIF